MTEINFCPVCGKELPDKTTEQCPSCGEKIRDTIRPDTEYVGFGTRFAAYIIDYIILFILCACIGAGMGLILGPMSTIIGYIIGVAVIFLYFILLETSSSQATLGKRIVHIIVVNDQSGRISYGQAFIRRFIISLPIVNIISAIIIDTNDKKQGLHDKAAKTYVRFKDERRTHIGTIILLIVVVLFVLLVFAAIFSYVMLGAGYYTTQKSQEVTYSGINQPRIGILIDGPLEGVYADGLRKCSVTLKVPDDGTPLNIGDILFLWTYMHRAPVEIDDRVPASGLIQPGSSATITLTIPGEEQPKTGESFSLEIKPQNGPSTLVTRTLPPGYSGGPII